MGSSRVRLQLGKLTLTLGTRLHSFPNTQTNNLLVDFTISQGYLDSLLRAR